MDASHRVRPSVQEAVRHRDLPPRTGPPSSSDSGPRREEDMARRRHMLDRLIMKLRAVLLGRAVLYTLTME